MNPALSLPELGSLRRGALVVGVVGSLLTLLGAFLDPGRFFHAYLVAYVYWLGLGLGCLGVVMVYHLTGGGWGIAIRRLLEAGAGTLPYMAVLFLPLVFGLHDLYEWTHTEAVMADPVLSKKVAYLNIPFFLVRAVVYFAAWLALGHFLDRWSGEQDRTGDPALVVKLRKLSGAGIVLYAFTMTFAAFDWVMSLQPHWFSTIFGMLFIAGQGLGALAIVVVFASRLSVREDFGPVLAPTILNDVGNLLLAFVMIWAYLAFSQLLIIWSGNLPEEITWYLHRISGGWSVIAMALAAFYFFRPVPRSPRTSEQAAAPAPRAHRRRPAGGASHRRLLHDRAGLLQGPAAAALVGHRRGCGAGRHLADAVRLAAGAAAAARAERPRARAGAGAGALDERAR